MPVVPIVRDPLDPSDTWEMSPVRHQPVRWSVKAVVVSRGQVDDAVVETSV